MGCFDAKTLDFLPNQIKFYQGFDANWENGLDHAKEKYKNQKKYNFELCTQLSHFSPSQTYDISIAMETLEHLPEEDIPGYLQQLSKATNQMCFITVPNEKRLMLVIKYWVKRIFLRREDAEPYTPKELWNAFRNRLEKVERMVGGHKGFDYEKLVAQLKNYFEVVEVNGMPIGWLSKHLYFSVGIVLRKKQAFTPKKK